jgi:hypothetical protein
MSKPTPRNNLDQLRNLPKGNSLNLQPKADTTRPVTSKFKPAKAKVVPQGMIGLQAATRFYAITNLEQFRHLLNPKLSRATERNCLSIVLLFTAATKRTFLSGGTHRRMPNKTLRLVLSALRATQSFTTNLQRGLDCLAWLISPRTSLRVLSRSRSSEAAMSGSFVCSQHSLIAHE